MTREEIEKFATEYQSGMSYRIDRHLVAFALEIVRRHNEELEQEFDSQWVKDIIRKAKPE